MLGLYIRSNPYLEIPHSFYLKRQISSDYLIWFIYWYINAVSSDCSSLYGEECDNIFAFRVYQKLSWGLGWRWPLLSSECVIKYNGWSWELGEVVLLWVVGLRNHMSGGLLWVSYRDGGSQEKLWQHHGKMQLSFVPFFIHYFDHFVIKTTSNIPSD